MNLLPRALVNSKAVSLVESFGFTDNGNGVIEEIPGFAEQGFVLSIGVNDVSASVTTNVAGGTTISLDLHLNGVYADVAHVEFENKGEKYREAEVTIRSFISSASVSA